MVRFGISEVGSVGLCFVSLDFCLFFDRLKRQHRCEKGLLYTRSMAKNLAASRDLRVV